MSIEAPKIPLKAIEHSRSDLISYLRTFHGGVLKENRLRPGIPSFERLPARNQCRFDDGDHSRTGVEDIYRESMDGANRIILSVVTINVIERVTALLENSGAVVRAFCLKEWLRGLISTYRDRRIS